MGPWSSACRVAPLLDALRDALTDQRQQLVGEGVHAWTRGGSVARHTDDQLMERAFGARDGLSWPHLDLIRKRFPGKVLIKGVLHPDDILRAKEIVVDGFMVSNHGGRQLDGAVSGLRMLEAALQVAGGLPVIYDGGVRRGTDVLKAYALGAAFVFVGRPMLSAAVVRGQPGVERAIDLLQEEIHRDLALIGANAMDELGPQFLMLVGATG